MPQNRIKILRKMLSPKFSIDDGDRVVVFVCKRISSRTLRRLISRIGAGKKADFKIICLDTDLADSHDGSMDIEVKHDWDYLDAVECGIIDNFFFKKLTKEWSFFGMPDGGDVCNTQAKRLSYLTEFDFIISNLALIKYMEVVRRFFLDYGPSKIIILEDTARLSGVVGLFKDQYKFGSLRIGRSIDPLLKKLCFLCGLIKNFITDLFILFLDFFVFRLVMASKKFNNAVVIDHRLYKKFPRSASKNKFLACPFEKGLKVRLEMVLSGTLYLPMRPESYFDFFPAIKSLYPFVRQWGGLKQNAAKSVIFEYRGKSFWKAIEGYIYRTFLFVLPRTRRNIKILKRFIALKNPKLFVMRDDLKEIERTIIHVSGGIIPTLVVQHGILGDPNTGDVLCAGMTAVWGNASIEWYKQFGYGSERFVVTGNPVYDDLYRRISSGGTRLIKDKVCRELNLDPHKKIVTFLTSANYLCYSSFYRYDRNQAILRDILAAMKSFPEAQLLVKFHPYDEKLTAYSDIVNKRDRDAKVAFTRDYNIFDILQASDLVINIDSSCGLEALILDKPVIALGLTEVKTLLPYAARDVAIGVNKSEDIYSAIKDSLYNEGVKDGLRAKRKNFVFEYAYRIDGQATRRVEELIDRLASD